MKRRGGIGVVGMWRGAVVDTALDQGWEGRGGAGGHDAEGGHKTQPAGHGGDAAVKAARHEKTKIGKKKKPKKRRHKNRRKKKQKKRNKQKNTKKNPDQ